MKGFEAIERAKSGGSAANVANDILRDALARLEREIGCKAEIPFREYDEEQALYACGGGVADGYDDMYVAYLKREASLVREDWDCYGSYDTVFNIRYTELCKEIIRNRKPKRFQFATKGRMNYG